MTCAGLLALSLLLRALHRGATARIVDTAGVVVSTIPLTGYVFGSVTLYASDDRPPEEIWLVGMWVAAHARGGGAAQALVEAAVAQARADGLERVVLEVAENNPRARAAYSRMGFVETGEAGPSSTHPRVCELEMVRYLTG